MIGTVLPQFEEREYTAGLKWVCTKKTLPKDSVLPSGQMFWKLFKYISGQNSQSKDLLS